MRYRGLNGMDNQCGTGDWIINAAGGERIINSAHLEWIINVAGVFGLEFEKNRHE